MSLIPADKFKAFAPRADEATRAALEQVAEAHKFSGLVLAHWLGQMFVESAGFTTREESLNYSVDGLLKTFGRHRISEADARKYGRAPGRPANQEAIANLIYGGEWGRKNLGNTQPGDGWRFRGSGDKQITGRANIVASGFTPEQLRTDPVASANASAEFFVRVGCAAPALRDDVSGVTKKVNGGFNGLAARDKATAAAKKVVGL
jgi:putative chitinase